MTTPIVAHSLSSRGCYSETGRLRKVVMCPPTYFRVVKSINIVQRLYSFDGCPDQHRARWYSKHQQLHKVLCEQGVEVVLLPPVPGFPFQHTTRGAGTVLNNAIIVSDHRELSKQSEVETTHVENTSVSAWLAQPGFDIIALACLGVIKSGEAGSARRFRQNQVRTDRTIRFAFSEVPGLRPVTQKSEYGKSTRTDSGQELDSVSRIRELQL